MLQSRPLRHELSGRRFGRWLVAGRGPASGRWLCVCDCGSRSCVSSQSLVSGRSKSCGCLNSERLKEPRPYRRKEHSQEFLRERNRAYQRKWQQINWTKVALQKREANARQRDAKRAWRERNREAERASAREHARRRRGAPGQVSQSEWLLRLAEFGGLCAYCLTREGREMDHVVPLSRGGTHTIDNAVPACRVCNATKSAKSMLECAAAGIGVVRSARNFEYTDYV